MCEYCRRSDDFDQSFFAVVVVSLLCEILTSYNLKGICWISLKFVIYKMLYCWIGIEYPETQRRFLEIYKVQINVRNYHLLNCVRVINITSRLKQSWKAALQGLNTW